MIQKFLLSVLLVLSVWGAPAAAPAQSSAEGTTLAPGDAVRITVWRKPDLTGEYPIAEDGSISHPLFREVRVTGVALPVVDQRLRDYLSRLEANPQFVVQPLLRVSVGGEVRQPSLYRLPPETSLAEAVALAGGATERGRLERVRLFRGGEEILIDLTRPEIGAAQQPIRSGDQIFVARRASVFREYVAPAGSITAALVALANLVLR